MPLILEKNEHTTKSLVDWLNKKGTKDNGKPFTHGDVSQYCLRGYLPHKYGGNDIVVVKQHGVKIIKILKTKSNSKPK